MGYAARSVGASAVLSGIPVYEWDAKSNSPAFVDVAGTWQIETVGFGTLKRLNNEAGASNQNDEVDLGVVTFPKAGNYTMYLSYYKQSTEGILHLMLDDSDQGALFDLYDAGGVSWAVGSASIGAQVASTKRLCIKVATKNGASSDYRLNVYAIMIVPTE